MSDRLGGGAWRQGEARGPYAFLQCIGAHSPFWSGPLWFTNRVYTPLPCSTAPGSALDNALREGIR